MLLNHKLLLWLIDKHSHWHIPMFSILCSVVGISGRKVKKQTINIKKKHLIILLWEDMAASIEPVQVVTSIHLNGAVGHSCMRC